MDERRILKWLYCRVDALKFVHQECLPDDANGIC